MVDPGERRSVNDGDAHLDVMVGSEHLEVTGFGRDGREKPLLRDGRWVL
jgi:leucyl aminopeptidase (aminopeptidase T)